MKCEIIKDLLPSYAEQLTSNESNDEIKEHLKICKECSEFLDEMKVPLDIKVVQHNKEDIKPFKKLNSKVFQAIMVTLAICIVGAGSYFYFWGIGWKANSEDIEMTYEYKNGSLTFHYQLTNGLALSSKSSSNRDEREEGQLWNHSIAFREAFVSIFDYRGDGYSHGIGVLDEDDKYRPFVEKDIITIIYSDKVEVIRLKEIAEELGLQ